MERNMWLKALYIFLLGSFATLTSTENMANDCRPQTDSGLSQYIIGYGSLMQEKSKSEDSAKAGKNMPIYLYGFERGFIERSKDTRFGSTYLGVKENADAKINAVYFKLNDPKDIHAYDKREHSYCRVKVPKNKIEPLAGIALPEGQYWIYIPLVTNLPSSNYPLTQSYVDIFLSGCLELESKYNLPDFAKNCVKSTNHWSKSWVNDRVYPRTAHDNIPYAQKVDSLILETLPEYIKHIKIESCRN
jgi:hypothetical protein